LKWMGLMAIAFLGFAGWSCKGWDSNSSDCDYSDCTSERPDFGELYMTFSINEENSKVPYTVFLGDREEGIVFFRDSAVSRTVVLEVPVNYYYTVEAHYLVDGKSWIAVDGDKVKRKSYTECDSTCYYVPDGVIKLRLTF
jgi:hypothetical protein